MIVGLLAMLAAILGGWCTRTSSEVAAARFVRFMTKLASRRWTIHVIGLLGLWLFCWRPHYFTSPQDVFEKKAFFAGLLVVWLGVCVVIHRRLPRPMMYGWLLVLGLAPFSVIHRIRYIDKTALNDVSAFLWQAHRAIHDDELFYLGSILGVLAMLSIVQSRLAVRRHRIETATRLWPIRCSIAAESSGR